MTTPVPMGALATTVLLAYSIAVIFTFPLQNFPSLESAGRSIFGGINAKSCVGAESSVFRHLYVIWSLLMSVLAVIALSTMKRLDKVVRSMGSSLGCPIAFVFPPFIHTKLDPNLSQTRRFGHLQVARTGICGLCHASHFDYHIFYLVNIKLSNK
jgi:solute carrier family 36 (proton-coupled amino acid transporter)